MSNQLKVICEPLPATLPGMEVHLLGRKITCMTAPSVIQAVHNACAEERRITVLSCNVHGFNLSLQLPWFYESLQRADIVRCDSMGILKAIRFMGLNLPDTYQVSWTHLMSGLLDHCDQQGFSVFLLGSKPQHLQRALDRVRLQYPNIRLAGHHGYFSADNPAENNAVVEQINRVNPQILIVGMGMPVQEHWVRCNQDRLDVNAVMVGGAVIDRLAGVVPDCPELLANRGFEWLYRLIREPKRLWVRYVIGNLAFALQIALAKYSPFHAKLLDPPPTQVLAQPRTQYEVS